MLEASTPALRQLIAERRQAIHEQFLDRGNTRSTLRRLTDQIDGQVRAAAERFLEGFEASVAAIGGYGREELFPASDIDLLIIVSDRPQEGREQAVKNLLHHLWDLGLQLGQQVWSLQELRTLDPENIEFALALMDARPIAGNAALARELLDGIFPQFLKSKRQRLVERVLEITRRRHQAYRNTIYQLEPDLKQSPGGLRDYWIGVWLQRLQRREAFLPSSREEIRSAYEFVCRLRLALHWTTGRKVDRLSHRLQDRVAPSIGYAGKDSTSAVESLMNKYFLSAHVIANFCRRNMAVHESGRPDARTEVAQGESVDDAFDVLRLFARSLDLAEASSQEMAATLSEKARDAVVRALPRFSSTLQCPQALGQLKALLPPRPGLYRVLSEMYELGVLEQILPEFSGIKERVIRDFYHCYTVDEHTLQAVKSLGDLANAREASDLRFRRLLEGAEKPHLLTLALLLHDVGKSREGNHAQRSARMAAKALRRLRFEPSEIDRVVSLVSEHLSLSNVVFRRDLDDPREAARFADRIRDAEQLRLLTLLTYADIRAVGPGILSDWKKDLIFQLYVEAYNHLTRGYGRDRIGPRELSRTLMGKLPSDLPKDAFQGFLEGFPRRYLSSTSAEEVFEHFRMAERALGEGRAQLRVSPKGECYQLCVVTPDQSRLFARIAGCLAYYDMSIRRGYGFANAQGVVLDLFQFEDTRQRFAKNPVEIERFRRLLEDVMTGSKQIEPLLERKRSVPAHSGLTPSLQPSAYFGQGDGEGYSILEIVTPDSLGLLYRIGTEIAAMECNIDLVLISTEGAKAVDVFYLSHEGRELPQELRQALPARIVNAIQGES